MNFELAKPTTSGIASIPSNKASVMSKVSLKNLIKKHSKSLGFDLVGFSPIDVNDEAFAQYKNWLQNEFEADMSYMSEEARAQKRSSADNLLENAKTVISLAVNYYHDQPPLPKNHGRIARYAYGRDYHKTISKNLKKLEEFIQENTNGKTISYVDTGPILERTFATQAGLGFIGKNTCLITDEFGSWVFLAEIITNLEIQPRGPKSPTCKKINPGVKCGSCTKCIDACPTGAIKRLPNGTYAIDANLCLSYHTIENREPSLPPKSQKAIHKTKRIFGCDICQEVCPHNCRAKSAHANTATTPKPIAGSSLPLAKIASLKTDEEFTKAFAGSPIMRAKRKNLQRNAGYLT